jgi:hypothetical protein
MLHPQQYAVTGTVRSLMRSLQGVRAACENLAKPSVVNPHDLLRLELTAITHVLQARAQMRELGAADSAIVNQIKLFLAVTDCLEGTAPAKDKGTNLEGAGVRLIGGYIPAPTLIALATAMGDVLELCCAACDDAPVPVLHQEVSVSEALVWATGPDVAGR